MSLVRLEICRGGIRGGGTTIVFLEGETCLDDCLRLALLIRSRASFLLGNDLYGDDVFECVVTKPLWLQLKAANP